METFYQPGMPNQNPSLYTFDDSGIIYFIFENDSFEYKMYDFNATVGDTVKLFTPKFGGGGIDSFQVTIDSIITENFSGSLIDVYYNSQVTQSNYLFGDWIYNIGSDYGFLPLFGAIDPPESGILRCYEDGTTGLLKFTGLVCDTIILGVEDFKFYKKINLFPNPANLKIFNYI